MILGLDDIGLALLALAVLAVIAFVMPGWRWGSAPAHPDAPCVCEGEGDACLDVDLTTDEAVALHALRRAGEKLPENARLDYWTIRLEPALQELYERDGTPWVREADVGDPVNQELARAVGQQKLAAARAADVLVERGYGVPLDPKLENAKGKLPAPKGVVCLTPKGIAKARELAGAA